MEFKLKIYEYTEDGLFAEVVDEEGNRVCIGEGDNPYSALEDACLEFAEMLKECSERENSRILEIFEKKLNNTEEVRYSLDEVKKMLKNE